MAIAFNAEEILEMAKTIERNGAAFYRAAADRSDRPEIKAFFMNLVAMEEDHERRFRDMQERGRRAGTLERVFDPDYDAGKVLKAWADGFVFPTGERERPPLEGAETLEAILRKAVEKEKDSILFYLGLRDAATDPADRAVIDEVIREEMAHLVDLNVAFERFKSGGP